MSDTSSGYTSFLPLTPEAKGITSGFSFARIFDFPWKKNRQALLDESLSEEQEQEYKQGSSKQQQDDRNEVDSNDIEKSGSQSLQSSAAGSSLHPGSSNFGISKSENSSPNMPRKEKGRYRNVKTILRRLSAIAVDKRWHQTSGDFRHDFKQYWMPDEHCKECYECGGRFNTFRRRHHCRVCGQIFCSRCCSQEVPGRTMGFNGHIRVCNYCYKIVKAYVEDDLDKSLLALKEDMKICNDEWNSSDPIGLHPSGNSLASLRSNTGSFPSRDDSGLFRANSSNSLPGIIERDITSPLPVPRNPFDAFGVTPEEANDIKQDFLRDLWRQITDVKSRLELQSHRFRLKTYNNCFIGHELVDWLLTYGKAANRAQGVAIGQDLLDLGWIESIPATEEDFFKDEYMLYQPGKVAVFDMELQGTLCGLSEVEESLLKIEKGDDDSSKLDVSEVDDDDETVPFWFRQISSETTDTLTEYQEPHSNVETPHMARRFSSSRHLDLDQATIESGVKSSRAIPRELSLQMKLDYFSDDSENQVRKEIYDQVTKLSLITHVPPPPLDTYVCVEGHPFATKKRISKVASSSHLPDDVLRGIVDFPKPSSIHEENIREQLQDESGEGLARDRLSFAFNHHLVALLKQLIKQDGLSLEWKDVIMPIVTRISEKVVPDVRRDDDMDIRRYVWFKTVPVGDVPDCQVVSGVVFTKNVVHKKMNCTFTQPRILMLSCAIEYQRVENKLTSIDPVVLQEYEFLKNFIARIVTLKPNIVLVERTVARVAQDMLRAAGITLVHNIKSNVMENIARCTGADILQSIEQVSRPRLGSCQHFRLHKYSLPDEETKTLMFFEGCAPDLGCSLVLQGASKDILAKVKKIMKYLIYVAYHLKLENKFLMDEFALPPILEELVPMKTLRSEKNRRAFFKICEEDDDGEEENSKQDETQIDLKPSKTKQQNIVEESERFSELLSRIILSSSPFCVYQMPYLLKEDGQTCSCRRFIPDQLYESKLLRSDEVDLCPEPVKQPREPKQTTVSPNVIMNEPHPFTRPDVVPRLQDHDTKCLLADFRARGGLVDLKTYRHFDHLQKLRRKEVNIKKRNKLETMLNARSQIEDTNEVDNRNDEKCTGVVDERDKKMDCFDPYNHQRIAVLFSSYSSESHNAPKPCISPWAVFMEFYGRNDITLGGFLERYCFRPSYICFSHNCDVPMINHVRYFAHGDGSLYIHMRNLDTPIPGYDRTILTWSWCKQCKQVTPVVPLSFESWSLSFAKYLELRFYGGQYTRRASAEPCGHSLHHDHFQYFSFANMVASFKYRPIELYEVILPTAEVLIGKERQPKEWAEDVEEFCSNVKKAAKKDFDGCLTNAFHDMAQKLLKPRTSQVLMQIVERINDLRTVDLPINAARDQKIKDFQAEFQVESHFFNEFIQCLKMKVDSLLSFHRQEAEDQCVVSASSESTDVGISLKLNPSEVSALMTGIGNMLIKLQAQLCVIVLNWNSKLQEFIQLEKKREKNTKLSSSPKSEDLRIQPSNAVNEMGEMYFPVTSVDSLIQDDVGHCEDSEAIKYTYIRTPKAADKPQPESVSEVLLTDGTILRQTFIGTHPPRNYIASIREGEVVAEKKDEPNASDGKEAAETLRENLSLDLKDDSEFNRTKIENQDVSVENSENEKNRQRVSSPYMVIKSPVLGSGDAVPGNLSVDSKSLTDGESSSRKSSYNKMIKRGCMTRTGSIQVERGSVSENDYVESVKASIASISERVESPGSNQSYNSQEHWMAGRRERSDTVINTMDYNEVPKLINQRVNAVRNFDDASSHHSSLFVEDSSDVDLADLISLQDVLDFPDDDKSYMSDGDNDKSYQSEVDDASDIGLGESAVDYESFVKLFEDDNEEGIAKKGNLETFSRNESFTSCDSIPRETEKTFEDYFTSTTSQQAENIVEEVLNQNNVTTEKLDQSEVSETHQSDTGEAKAEENLESNANISSKHGAISSKHADECIVEAGSSALRDSDVSSNQSSRISFTDDHFNGEIERILKSNAKRSLFERLDAHAGSVDLKNGHKPINGDLHARNIDISDSVGHLHASSVPQDTPNALEPTRDDLTLPRPKSTSFSEGRLMGHRRMQSAPAPLTPTSQAHRKSIVDFLPGSPFELVKSSIPQESALSRVRSLSHGDYLEFVKGQEELKEIAEKICQVDQKDLEMDDPEEIQFDESINESLTTAETGSKVESISEKKSRDSSEVFENEAEKEKKREKARMSKGTSEADESERESCSSASVSMKARGHVRQKSLPYRAFGLMDGKDDGEFSKSSTLELSNNVTGQKKGSEKMKKIISHLLPGSNFQPVPPPFPPHEHYLLPPGDSVSVVVNEKEPTSIIAYSLSSADYNDQLNALQILMVGGDETDSQQSTRLSGSPVKKEIESLESNANGVILRRRKTDLTDAKRPRSWAGMSSKTAVVEYAINFEADASKKDLEPPKLKETKNGTVPSGLNRMSLADQYLMSSAKFSENGRAPSELLLESQTAADSDDLITDSLEGILDDKDDLDSNVDGVKSELQEDKFGKKKADSKASIDYNIKLQFQDNSAKFYCNVYYAEQFRQLRELIFPEGEERYIQSLSRCVFWKARGGKSGSSFSKSLDDRFVMKQMSRLEAQSFRDFAPQYFQYMDKALKEQRPTTLAKILGVYRIGFKNSQTNTTMRQDVLVMENLFYNLKVNKIFDLKGSVRSRYVHTSGKEEVLMDENLLEMICESPLFIRPHSKAVLSKAIHNDSEFLSSHSVMDYSLLVGIDEVNFELVVGIIDYIRTYTWDKKLESYVKSTGILGGQGKMPTVVSPAVYKTRFTEAMHRYFLMVPDKWTGFGADLH